MSDQMFRRGFAVLLAPALLALVASGQRLLAWQQPLNPWKGGGFGMFADVNRTANRLVWITPIDEAGNIYSTPVPQRFAARAEALRTLPSDARVRAFAERLAAEDWRLVGEGMGRGAAYPVLARETGAHEASRALRLRHLLVEVVELEFDRASATVRIPMRGGTPLRIASAAAPPLPAAARAELDRLRGRAGRGGQ